MATTERKLSRLQAFEVLRNLDFFEEFGADELNQLMPSEHSIVHLDKDRIIIKEGDEGEGDLYIILAGDAIVTKSSDFGNWKSESTPLAVLRPGAFFGEISFLSDNPRTTSVYAITDISLFKMNKESLAKCSRGLEIKIRIKLTKRIIARLDQMNKTFSEAAQIR